MDAEDIPQHGSATYHGHQKVVYATRDGHYVKAVSNGWDDEAFATEQAVAVLRQQAEAARVAVQAGQRSPLYYAMCAYRHDVASLARSAGLFQWQVRRHFKPAVFVRLSDKTLAKYAAVLQLDACIFRQPFDPAHFRPPYD